MISSPSFKPWHPPLRRSLAAFLGRFQNQSRHASLDEIDPVIAELELLNGSTERDFMAVGEKLMEFRGAARQISSEMECLIGLFSGERGRGATETLDRILGDSRGIQAGIERSGQKLATVRELAGRLRSAFSGLPNMVATFRTLCTLTRVEASRLGSLSREFGDLAEEVRALSESIQASGDGVLDAVAGLDKKIQTAIASASGARLKQLQELPTLIATVSDGIRAFAERQRRVHEASVRQAAEYQALCGAIDSLVPSLQFHDITRQQVEHVIDALRGIRTADRERAHSVIALQRSQMKHAGRVFADAVNGIERDLEIIALRCQRMTENSRNLLGDSANDRCSFFASMENCFSEILEAVAACESAQSEIHATTAEIEHFENRMGASVDEVRLIEIRIRRIALNATIRAAHIGADGDALGVIADAMQQMAYGSSRNTEDAALALDRIGTTALNVSGSEAAQAVTGDATHKMRQAMAELHSASELSSSHVARITNLASRLSEDIDSLRTRFSAGAVFSEVASRASAELERIAGHAPAAGTPTPADLRELATHYTMQIERDIHQSVTLGATTVMPSAAEANGQGQDLGENVELF